MEMDLEKHWSWLYKQRDSWLHHEAAAWRVRQKLLFWRSYQTLMNANTHLKSIPGERLEHRTPCKMFLIYSADRLKPSLLPFHT